VKFINTSKAFYSYIETLRTSSAKYWKFIQECTKERNIEYLYQKMEIEEGTNDDSDNYDDAVGIDQNVCSGGAESDDDSLYCDTDDVMESEKSVEDLSIVEFNSTEIKARFINVNIPMLKLILLLQSGH